MPRRSGLGFSCVLRYPFAPFQDNVHTTSNAFGGVLLGQLETERWVFLAGFSYVPCRLISKHFMFVVGIGTGACTPDLCIEPLLIEFMGGPHLQVDVTL